MLKRLAEREYNCFLDRYSRYHQILIHPNDQEMTTFTCPFCTYAFKLKPFGFCNAHTTFMRYMIVIFTDMLEDDLDVFMKDFRYTEMPSENI